MSSHSVRGHRGLVPLPSRALTLSLLALGGLLWAPSARAAEPGKEEGPVATITRLKLADGSLRVGIRWSDTQPIPDGAKLVSYDGNDNVNASTEVSPKPGEETEVSLDGAVKEPWETGWAQSLVLEDSKGEALATQPYNVNMECADEKDCALTVAPGVAANKDVVHVSAELDEAITKIEANNPDQEVDLVEKVSKDSPHLRGEVLVYVHTMAKRLSFAGPCSCVWQAVYTRIPTLWGYGINITNPSGTIAGWNGPGAKHALTAIGGNAAGIGYSVTGTTQVTLKLNCTRWIYYPWVDVHVLPWPGSPYIVIPFPWPRLVPCSTTCAARFDHMGRVSGSTFVAYTSPGSSATAREQGVYRVDNVTYLNASASQGSAFNQGTTTSVWSNLGSTGRADSYGYVQASSTFPYFGSGSVANGHVVAIHGQSWCPYGPYGHAAVWLQGTSQGIPQTNYQRATIQNFFWQWGLWVSGN